MAVKKEKKYILTNRRSGKVLTAFGESAVQLTTNSSDEQIWRAVPTEGTAVQLINKATGKALCVNDEAKDGALVVLGENAQEWKLITTTKGYRKLIHVESGKSVDIKDISDHDYAPAQLWVFVRGENQEWIAEEVEKEVKTTKRTSKKSK